MFPLQGIPGLPELLVILLVLLMFSVPVLLAVGAGAVYVLFVRESDEDEDGAADGPPDAPASAAGSQSEGADDRVEESGD